MRPIMRVLMMSTAALADQKASWVRSVLGLEERLRKEKQHVPDRSIFPTLRSREWGPCTGMLCTKLLSRSTRSRILEFLSQPPV